MKPEPEPAGTSVAVPSKSSTTTRDWVTNTVEGAASRKTAMVLRSLSMSAPEPSGAMSGGGQEAEGSGAEALSGSGPGSRRHPPRAAAASRVAARGHDQGGGR